MIPFQPVKRVKEELFKCFQKVSSDLELDQQIPCNSTHSVYTQFNQANKPPLPASQCCSIPYMPI